MGMGLTRAFLPILASQLDPTGLLVGFVTSAWFLARVFIELPSGIISDRIGRRKLLVGGLGIAVFGSFICATATSIYALILGRAIWGLGVAFFFTNSTALVLDLFDSDVRGRAVGNFRGVEFIGSFIGAPIGAFLADFMGFSNVFYVTSIMILSAFLLAFVSGGLRRVGSRPRSGSGNLTLKETIVRLRDFELIALCIATFSRMFVMQGVMSTVFQLYLNQRLGLSVGLIGIIMSSRTAGLIVATVISGHLSDRFGRKPIIIGGLLVGSLCLYLYTVVFSFEEILVVGIADGLGSGLVSTTLVVLLSDIASSELLGGAVGLYRTFMDLGGIFGPVISMFLFNSIAIHAPFLAATGLLLANFVLVASTVKMRIKKE